MTNEQKLLALADAAERLRTVRPHYATLAEVLRDPAASETLEEIDRGLERLTAETGRLKAERSGGADPVLEGAGRLQEAERYTRDVEDGFRADLARLGHHDDHTPVERRRIEEQALGVVEETHGTAAAERCRRLIEPFPQEETADDPASPLDGLHSVPTLP